ncbi:MAG: D-glycero-beta-D-manno-heptose-7-phosphate kinase [Bacteroidetes bacterium]|nr:D-glycero-beta-D-manno-heptose-7-phosphate kinase [Bacteroidota bacterium]
MHTDFDSLFRSFRSLRVLIVGDVMVDAYYFGSVDRISPEAPVPVVLVDKQETRLGGAGNVALNVHALGAQPVLCTVIGTDKEGEDLRALLREQGLSERGILESDKRKTTTKTRVIGNKHQIVRIDHELTGNLDKMDSFLLLESVKRELEQADVLIMEDYNKGVLHEGNIKAIIALAKEAGVPVVVDPKKKNFLEYTGVTLFKPNLKEIREGLNLSDDLRQLDHLSAAVAALQEKLGNTYTMVTLSEQGVYIAAKDQSHHVPAHVRNIADVSGAGDTVVSVAALCLALGTELRLLAALSNLAGGIVCEQTGVVPIQAELLKSEAERLLL